MAGDHRGDHRDPRAGQMMPMGREGYVAGPANSSMAAVAQLFARLSQEIEETQPPNCIHFIVNFLCKHYPEHLHGFASIWNMDPDLERERHEVVNFFKSHKISTAVAAHFTNAGYDTLDTLTTLSPDQLVDVEAFNNVKWLPGHKVRLQQIFSEIPARIRAYRQANPNQTAQVVGHVGHLPPSPSSISGVRALPTTSSPTGGMRALPSPYQGSALPGAYQGGAYQGSAPGPGAPREYVVGVSEPVRVGPQALPGPGVDMNRHGIPDVLQQPNINYMGAPGALALPGQAGRGVPQPARGAPQAHAPLGHAPQGHAPQGHAAHGGGFMGAFR